MKKYLGIIALVASALLIMRWWLPVKPIGDLPETIIVGTSADFPPFSAIDEQGAIVGFDVDLIDAVFKKMNKQYTLENMPFESLLPQMQLGSIQVIAAGLSKTRERKKCILFSKPYLPSAPFVAVTRVGDEPIASLDALAGKQVIVNHGYTSDLLLSPRTDITLTRLPSPADALMALDHQLGDVFVTGSRSLSALPEDVRKKYTITELPGPQFPPGVEPVEFDATEYGQPGYTILGIPGNETPTAFGIAKKYPALVPAINQALDELEQEGTLAQLYEKWNIA